MTCDKWFWFSGRFYLF